MSKVPEGMRVEYVVQTLEDSNPPTYDKELMHWECLTPPMSSEVQAIKEAVKYFGLDYAWMKQRGLARVVPVYVRCEG